MITPIYVAVLTAMLVFLIVDVVRLRNRFKVSLGESEHPELQRAVRIHGNFVETVPWAILLMFLIEYQDGNVFLLHAMGIAIVVGRILHRMALKSGTLKCRVAGMALTMTVFIIGAAYNLYLAHNFGV